MYTQLYLGTLYLCILVTIFIRINILGGGGGGGVAFFKGGGGGGGGATITELQINNGHIQP